MITELKFQEQILKSMKDYDSNCYATKVNQRFLAGFPDLLLATDAFGPLFVETKLGHLTKNGTIKIGTTGIQRFTLRRMRKAGLSVAVWTLVQNTNSPFIVRTPDEVVSVEMKEIDEIYELSKGKWPMVDLLRYPRG